MGLNAQTTVPTFTANQVLTADQQNQSARTGVPVFATTVERDAAFGGSGEKTLAEGQLCYLESTNVVQYYDGAAWATVGPSSAGGLVFITGATFTTATSVSAVADTFTSTYRNYRIVVNFTACATDTLLSMRLRASGSDITTSSYYNTIYTLNAGGAAGTVNTFTQTSWDVGALDNFPILGGMTMDVLSPKETDYTTVLFHGYTSQPSSTSQQFRIGGLQFYATTSADSFSIISSSASAMSGQYRVYGYANS